MGDYGQTDPDIIASVLHKRIVTFTAGGAYVRPMESCASKLIIRRSSARRGGFVARRMPAVVHPPTSGSSLEAWQVRRIRGWSLKAKFA